MTITWATAGMLAIGVVLILIGVAFLRNPEAIRRFAIRALHLMYGKRLPGMIWKPVAGGVAFLACGIVAILLALFGRLGT